ncbi:probable bifunctional TENA-E protein [Vicia villosa]|uniref:probable bifunctional TENA-E protein n=1 Tax=Vicia villosa TaxID=3911 RepID=UPI00273C9DFD|nr:probable bifunctional TENA-E protein [Vicia villosa]
MQETGMTEKWLRKHSSVYNSATKHPFILSIRDGTVQSHSFKTRLAQDYLFVREFVPFVASVLIKACKDSDDSDDVEVILGGLAAFNDDISWFKREANKRDIRLSEVVPQKANKDYCRLLESLMSSDVEYTVALTVLWACGVVYLESFAYCIEKGSKTALEWKEICERWGTEGFGQYCQTLQKMVDRRLLKDSDEEVKKAEVVFLCIVEHEVEFWNMSSGN